MKVLSRVDRDDRRDDEPRLHALGPLVELLAELGRRDAVGTESRSHGRRGSRLPRRALQLDDRSYLFLSHCLSPFVVYPARAYAAAGVASSERSAALARDPIATPIRGVKPLYEKRSSDAAP